MYKMRYIGSKRALLKNIDTVLAQHTDGSEQTFLDLFGGTNVVGRYFKDKYTVISNDLLYFSYVDAKATIANNSKLTFTGLKKLNIDDPFDYFNNDDNINPTDHYYENAYTPTGGPMYFTVENGRRIDFIRDTIDEWKNADLITEDEYYYLVSSLIQAIPFVSNITGTYGAFLKKWDKRALNKLTIEPLSIIDNGRPNQSFNTDSNDLVRRIETDITYVDTPYNNRQYASNYHVLENIARNNKPEVKGKTHIFDWKNLRSDYSMQRKALSAMEDLISNIHSKHVVLSYSNEGIIPEKDLFALVKKYATSDIESHFINYRKYKSKVRSKQYDLHEILIYFSTVKTITAPRTSSKPINSKKWVPQSKGAYIKSPLNYIGGKYKLLPQIIPLFPEKIDTFVDLFSGGANVGINVNANKYYFNDMNYRINEMFRFFKKYNSYDLINQIKKRIEQYGLSKTNQEAYLKFRDDYNANPNPLDLYILVSYSYNYQFRFNNSMEFNNPFGKNRSSFSHNMEKNLIMFVNKLHSIDALFTDSLFDQFNFSHLDSDDFVYMDPPYLITTGNYNDGNRGFVNWGTHQEKALYQLMDQLSERHIKFALSNVLDHKGQSNDLLKEYIATHNNVHVFHLNKTYRNSSYNTTKGDSDEILLTNYDPFAKRIDTLF